jgi:hypothetical protein
MLMAYDDMGFKIKDFPTQERRVPNFPIDTLDKAKEIKTWASSERPEINWQIVGTGPYSVREK